MVGNEAYHTCKAAVRRAVWIRIGSDAFGRLALNVGIAAIVADCVEPGLGEVHQEPSQEVQGIEGLDHAGEPAG